MTLDRVGSRLFCGTLILGLLIGAAGLFAVDKPASPAPISGIENLIQVVPGILSGSQPEGATAFQELARRGIRVIISVDGAAPDVAGARQAGLRYVHLPIGYDGIKPQSRADLVQAIQSAGGPVYMHCHHGKHRGPAAAAYCGVATGQLSVAEALEVMKVAGTKPDYAGLWDAVRKFELPQLPAGPLVETAEVEPMTAAMVRIDHHWSAIEQQLKEGKIDDGVEFSRITLLLAEEFRELPRTCRSPDEALNTRMKLAIACVDRLHQATEQNDFAAIKTASQNMLQSCKECHTQHRDH